MLLSAESCDLNCVRRRSEKRLRKTIRTLRKSINREQFHLHFAGADYELSKHLGQPAEAQGHCVAGQVLVGRKCGEWCLKKKCRCFYLSYIFVLEAAAVCPVKGPCQWDIFRQVGLMIGFGAGVGQMSAIFGLQTCCNELVRGENQPVWQNRETVVGPP